MITMKNKLAKILKGTLMLLAKWTLNKYDPGIIGITGSVGKTSTKEAIKVVLGSMRRIRASKGNLNNEIGLPLSIIGDWDKVGGFGFWFKVLWRGLIGLVLPVKYPEMLILEYGADKPGDIRYLTDIAKPKIGVVTAIGDIPVHVEFYSGPDAVAKEKSRLVEVLPAVGFAVLNFDDESVMDMKDRTRAHVITYGFGEGAQVRITNFETKFDDQFRGISFKMEYGGNFVPVRLDYCFGKAQAYAAAAAACVGLTLGMNLVRIAEALSNYRSPSHRMKLIAGIKESDIIDDSYNASPLSMHEAIDTVKSIKAKRKIGVLGDMLEIGKYSIEAHEAIGSKAGKALDMLFTVGPRAKFIAESANKAGLAEKNIFSFDTADEARLEVQSRIKKGDFVLVKASRALKLEKIIEEIRKQ